MLKEIIISIQAYVQAHQFIIKNKLWKWILIPGLIYSILFSVGIYLFWTTSTFIIEYILLKTGAKEWLQQMQNSWLNYLLIFAQIILHLIMLLFYFSLFKYIFLIIGSPLFAYLSEKTESIIDGGKNFPLKFSQLFKDIIRGVRLALRNLLWQTVYTLTILIISFIPIIGWVMPLVALLIECYYFGFSMLDYSCERNQLNTSQSITFINKHKGLAIGNGIVFYTMLLIPILGWILAPSYAVIAATISLHNAKQDI